MDTDKIKTFIRNIPGFPKPGIVFKDITPLLSDSVAFSASIDLMQNLIADVEFDMFAAAESRGFLLAAPLAYKMNKGLTILRKPGKLPFVTRKCEYDLEYGKAEIHMHIDAIPLGSKVIVVDDLLATGGTIDACCRLVEQGGGDIAGCLFLAELTSLKGREKLKRNHSNYKIMSLLEY